MPTAVISDIHANGAALRAVLADIDARGIERIVCLGDIIGYGPDPLECVDLVRERCEWCLLGNHDFSVLYEPTNFNPGAEAAAYWTRSRFDAEPDEEARRKRYEFLCKLRVRVVTSTGGNGGALGGAGGNGNGFAMLAVHGSPRRPVNEYIFPDDAINAPDKITTIFERISRLCFVGHTHLPGIFTDEPDFYPPGELENNTYRFTDQEKAIINVGSVGQPRDYDPRASYVVLHEDRAEFVRVEYDVAETADKIKAVPELNDWLGDRLYEGR